MRAEAQAHVDTINAALALLRRFLDWDRALRRLDELNARVEDQALWNDPKQAQSVMRERVSVPITSPIRTSMVGALTSPGLSGALPVRTAILPLLCGKLERPSSRA